MAELLLKRLGKSSQDAKKHAGLYKEGDLVIALPDGHVWGNREGLPNFWQVSVPGMTVEEAVALWKPGGSKCGEKQLDKKRLSPVKETTLDALGKVVLVRIDVETALKEKP